MNLHKRLGRLEEEFRIRQPDPLPKVLQELLPSLEHLAPEARDRVLHKEWTRLELRAGFIGHVLPGVFGLGLCPEEIERAVQVMLDVNYPGTPSPRDVDPGDIEEVARQKRNAINRAQYEKQRNLGHANTYGIADLLKPETADLLREAGQRPECYCIGGDWEVAAPWVDLGSLYGRERQPTGARPIYDRRRRP